MRTLKFLAAFIIFTGVTNVFGQKVYRVDSIADAKIKVYVTQDTADADLFVHVVSAIKEVNKDGLWYEVGQPWQANIKYYVVADPAQADLKIYYVGTPLEAGWQNRTKRHLLKY